MSLRVVITGGAGGGPPHASSSRRGPSPVGGRAPAALGLALLVALLLLVAAIVPAAAGAHASLKSATPATGSVLPTAPKQVVFVFSEHVEGSFGALRVTDEHGRRVDDGQITRPGGRANALAVGVRPGTPKGAYAATYRVISADGHPVSGGVTFVVGKDVTAAPPDVRKITASQAAPAGIGTALSLARVIRFAGIGGATGLLVLLFVVWLPLRRRGTVALAADEAFVRTAARTLRGVAIVGAVGALVTFVLQTANAGGTGMGGALRAASLREVLGTATGAWIAVTGVVFLLLLVGAPRLVRVDRVVRAPVALAGLVLLTLLVIAPALGGHAAASSPAWALVPIEIVHVGAMGAWLGGLLGLLVVLPRATRALPVGAPRSGLLAAVLLRFSPVALTAVALLTAAGTGLSLLYLTTLYDLTDTAYGRAVLIKACLVLVTIGIALLQREYLVPRLRRVADGDDAPSLATAGRHIRLALRAEVGLLAVVLIVTGALAGYPPPKALNAGPVSVSRAAGSIELQLTVDPSRVGANALHLYAFDRTGQPVRRVKELHVRAVPPGRSGSSDVPVDVPIEVAGPGHWIASGVPLGTAGTWKVTVIARLSAFDEVQTTLPVRVR